MRQDVEGVAVGAVAAAALQLERYSLTDSDSTPMHTEHAGTNSRTMGAALLLSKDCYRKRLE